MKTFIAEFKGSIKDKFKGLDRSNIILKLKSTGIYLLVPIINFAVSIFSTPLFAKHLSAEEFGYFGYYNSLISFLTIFFHLSFHTYYMSTYHRVSDEKRKRILITIVLFSLLWNVVFFPLAYFGVYFYIHYSSSVTPFFPYVFLALGGASLGIYKTYLQVDFRMQGQPLYYFLVVSGFRLLAIFASLYLVIIPELGLYGRMLGIFIVEILLFLVSMGYILRKHTITIERNLLKNAIQVILPLLPAALLYIPLLSFDNIVLEKLKDPAEMGLYNIGKSIAMYVYTALFPFFQTFEPDIYKYAVDENIEALKKLGFYITTLTVVAVLGFWVLSPFIIDFLTAGKYNESVQYANIIVVTAALMIVFSVFDAIIIALQKTRQYLYINAISAVICISLYIVLGHFFDQKGVAYASVLAFLFLISLQFLLVSKNFKKVRA
ncbi:lipopolysaccharide biosynthesis protein [Autumnicola musiva]|uniref:Oligosaccharide flippase family protein n=1 Tax=Autumnicola musiva TaxID=3075589 RepID=A0ABU3D839_9FLAO|nr:oligosaccharide flippase family protein [Zunongwangia sp. F117]MDT0677697.1 oligosaccharide flippase family protein [Zunongwangia sp. F117]